MNVRQLGLAQVDDDQGFTSGWDFDANRNASLAPQPNCQGRLYLNTETDDPVVLERLTTFGSSHPRGLNVVFGDGHTTHIRYGVDRLVFEQLGGRNNGIANAEE